MYSGRADGMPGAIYRARPLRNLSPNLILNDSLIQVLEKRS
jgi:hypothetical protein